MYACSPWIRKVLNLQNEKDWQEKMSDFHVSWLDKGVKKKDKESLVFEETRLSKNDFKNERVMTMRDTITQKKNDSECKGNPSSLIVQ